MLAYRSSTQESIGVSPCEMVFGRSIALPIDLVLGWVEPGTKVMHKSEYAYNLAEKLDRIHNVARNKSKYDSGLQF